MLVLPCGRAFYFSCPVPSVMLGTRIEKLELAAAIMAYGTFRSQIGTLPVLHFIDNVTARSWAIRGYSSDVAVADVLHDWLMDLAVRGMTTWFEYVASKANLADAPSRGVISDELTALAATRIESVSPPTHPRFYSASF